MNYFNVWCVRLKLFNLIPCARLVLWCLYSCWNFHDISWVVQFFLRCSQVNNAWNCTVRVKIDCRFCESVVTVRDEGDGLTCVWQKEKNHYLSNIYSLCVAYCLMFGSCTIERNETVVPKRGTGHFVLRMIISLLGVSFINPLGCSENDYIFAWGFIYKPFGLWY